MKIVIKILLIVIVVEILNLILIKKNNFIKSPIADLSPIPTIVQEPAIISKPTLLSSSPTPFPPKADTEKGGTEPWGISKQIDEHTWTIRVGEDATMATAKEIFEALNEYRKVQGSQVLTWDGKLGNYALYRAKYLSGLKSVDQHKGFNDFMENQDGFNKLGFTSLGENISYGYKLNGVHTIEWMYAGDKPHNDNQLNNDWNYVGIGVDGLATCLIFGTGRF